MHIQSNLILSKSVFSRKKILEYIDTVIRTLTCLKVIDVLDTQIQLHVYNVITVYNNKINYLVPTVIFIILWTV